jgi:hypothetical protein
MGRGPGSGMTPGRGRGAGMPAVMQPIHSLLADHQKVIRTVKEIPGGVETVTTSDDAAVTELVRKHTRQMKQQVELGQPIRMWDPLFVELFRHSSKVRMEITDVPGGVKVVNTSDYPQATLLIRQHATRGVSEFATGGFTRAHQPTPLPDGYAAP